MLLKNGDQALLLDTGYKRHFRKIKADLVKQGMTLSTIVVSHFHPDHIGGVAESTGVNIYGSLLAKNTLMKFFPTFDHLLPNNVVVDKKEFHFGKHKFLLIRNMGHSIDGLLVLIDDKFLFVADDLIYTEDLESVLPFCADHEIENHINSLKRIERFSQGKVIIPSHGLPIDDSVFLNKDIENRCRYLEFILDNPTASFETFTQSTGITFVGEESHSYNINKR
ncbi:MAG: MBL fold metallo-hydrolase [Firmicutes bacterium]|nr:MBL fold metallo-hydrolase [Bacillota bacterium]